MAKKSFKNSPAMQFISAIEPAEELTIEEIGEKQEKKEESLKKSEVIKEGKKTGQGREKEKPLRQDVGAGLNAATPKEIKKNVPMKANPLYVETRSKRVQLLMQPSLHDRLKGEAKKRGVSFNELVNGLLGGIK